MKIILVRRTPTGPQVRVFGLRYHHFTAGVHLMVLGAVLAWHDRADAWWKRWRS